ncbi:MAG: Photosynthesis system assembly factor, partial [Solirubrobacteraceae bacterium]|nr:Photosynthesis system assembly factor [Solirubrobacteraceae bacterium]
MRRISPRVLVSAAAVAVALTAAQPAVAGVWTPVASGTTSEISNIEYQSATRMWFTTKAGEIFTRQVDGTFLRTFGPSAIPLNDIEFLPGGAIGFAVGNNGQVLRSVNSGATWASVNTGGSPIPVSKKSTTFPDCTASEPLGNVNSVRIASPTRVYLFAAKDQMARSEPANAANLGAAGQWHDANRKSDNTCKLQTSYADGIDDAFFVPSNPDVAYITTAFFAETFLTTDDLATTATKQPADSGNGDISTRRMAGDPSNPNRMWVVGPGGNDLSYTKATTDGWNTSSTFAIGNPDAHAFGTPYDVDFAGGTVLVAGDGGMVLDSADGSTFYYNGADGAQATTGWRAAALASATDGAIGGVGGQLAMTAAANTIPAAPTPTPTPTPTPAPTPAPKPAPAFTLTGSGNGASARRSGGKVKVVV